MELSTTTSGPLVCLQHGVFRRCYSLRTVLALGCKQFGIAVFEACCSLLQLGTTNAQRTSWPCKRNSSLEPLMGMGRRGGASEGDWQCPNVECINHTKYVFGKHASCPSCGQPRNPKTVGDWLCPNPSCVNSRNSVFGKHQSCPKCLCLNAWLAQGFFLLTFM